MKIFRNLFDFYIYLKYRIFVNSADNVLWLINLAPQLGGFSILKEKNSVIFWIAHFGLLFYIFCLCNVFKIRDANNIREIIEANTGLSIAAMIGSGGYWFLTKRKLLISTLDKLLYVDEMSQQNEELQKKHTKYLRFLKWLVLIFSTTVYCNFIFIYLPQRINFTSALSTPNQCPGIDASTGISRHICRAMAVSHDFTGAIININYQALQIFTLVHTTCMYRLIAVEVASLRRFSKDRIKIKESLPGLIKRHGLLVDIVNRLRLLYNMPMGVNLGSNAYCICLFFSLPLTEVGHFLPVLWYNIFTFFIHCYMCQKLVDSSVAFEQSVYDCGWEDYDLSDMRSIYIVLKVAQKPVVLSAADMVPVNIYTFATATQFMFKLITVLKF